MSEGTFPKSWTQIPIEDCLLAYENGRKIRQGWSPQCESHPAETLDDWGVLKTSAIQDGEYVESANKHIPSKLKPRTQLEVEAGDILITCAGPRSRCGVTCLVRKTRPRLLISGKMYQLRADPEIIDRHVLELFLREYGTKKKIDEMKTGISDSGLNLTHSRFATLDVPLPPLNEQKRIVAKIEELFSELDAGEESLRQARRQLGVYRQSLLKQAFEGKLTAPWRKQNPDLLESPDQLLTRIQAEREERFEERMKRWEKGKKKAAKPRKLKPLAAISAELRDSLPEPPESWDWVHIDSYAAPEANALKAGPFGSSLKKQDYVPDGYKIYGQEQVISGDAYYGDYYISREKYDSLKNCAIQPGDILISLVGTVGKVLVLPKDAAAGIINPRLVKITPSRFLDADFFKAYFQSAFLKSLYALETHGATMDVLNLATIQTLPFPLCSLPEQQEIVRLLDEQFTVIEQNEREIAAALKRSEALRQSILKKAFTGQLVPQDPTDEPASELLARIREERNQAHVAKSPKKTNKTDYE